MALKGYGSYTDEALEEERNELDRTFGRTMKLKVGRNVLRLLPPKPDEKSPWKLIYVHFIDSVQYPLVCPKRMTNQPCPICQQVDKYRTSGDPTMRDKAKKYSAKRKWYANVIDRSAENEGPMILPAGKEIMDQINNHIKELREEKGRKADVTHPYEGYDFVIRRDGTGEQDTSYTVSMRLSTSPLGPDDDTMQGWLDNRVDLNEKSKALSYDEIIGIIKGVQSAPAGTGQRQIGADSGRSNRRTIEAEVTRPVATSEDEYDPGDYPDDEYDLGDGEEDDDIPY